MYLRSASHFFLFCLFFGVFFLVFTKPSSALTTPYRSAANLTTDSTVNPNPYTNLNNCSQTDGLTCDRSYEIGYANLFLKDFGDFEMPLGANVTHIRLRVTGKTSTPMLGLIVGLRSYPYGFSGSSYLNCQMPPDYWTMYALNSITIKTHEFRTPLTNGYLAMCVTPNIIKNNFFSFTIHYAKGYPWSANIDNFEIAFDYDLPTTPIPTPTPTVSPTPIPPEPFLDLPWDYESGGKSFEDEVFKPASWFDHEYPLQNMECCVTKVLYYKGKTIDYFYRSHSGYDYNSQNGVYLNTPVLAGASGWATYKPENLSGGAGNLIKIDHVNGYQTWYEHLAGSELIISSTSGKIYVEKGQKIGIVGMTGKTNGPHIHLSVFKDINNNGNFNDDYPWGFTDPLGWEGKNDDPWSKWTIDPPEIIEKRYGAKSFNLFTKRSKPKETVVPVSGGSVSLKDTVINFLGNTFKTEVKILIEYGPYETNGTIKSVKPSIFINAFDSLGNEVNQLLKPATITYDYLDADILNTNEESLKIYWYNETEDKWEGLPSNVDSLNNSVSAQTSHFSQFALMGEVKDVTTPQTQVIINGEKGSDNFYRSSVTVELNGSDNEDGVGLEYTLYSYNQSDWFVYTKPVLFSDEGEYTIFYQSIDKAYNSEERKTLSFRIDKTPPNVNIIIDPLILWPPNGKPVPVKISGAATDLNLYKKTFTIIDEYGNPMPEVKDFGESVYLEAKRDGNDLNGREYLIKAEAWDLAGNTSTASAVVKVPHDQSKK